MTDDAMAAGGDGMARRQVLASGAALASGVILAGARGAAGASPLPAGRWAGINHGTGFLPNEPYLSTCIRAASALGVRTVRQGMDTVGGRSEGASFTWGRRDLAFDRYREAGFEIHATLSFRAHVDRPNAARWERNWRNFVRQAMARYRDHVRVWIIDNEPELGFGGYRPTPEEAVRFTRIAWEQLHDLGLEGRCRIESPPVRAPDSGYLQDMLDAGLGRCCHVIGAHCYGGQIKDDRIGRPWERLRSAGLRNLTVAMSESGGIAAWAPSGWPGGAQAWRARLHDQLWVQAKAFGYEYAILFDLDRWRQREQEWRIAQFDAAGTGFVPVQPVWNAVRERWGAQRGFTNGGFEDREDGFGDWMVRHDPDEAAPPELRLFSFPRDAGRARSGSGCCRMNLAGHDDALVVRQVADRLVPGRRYTVTAHAFLTGGGATLKAIGFNRFDGLAEAAATTDDAGEWRRLTVQVTPSNPWLVVELRSRGTGRTGHEVRWDDVSVTAAG